PLTVTEASACCGIHFSGVSRHLTQLRRAGVVRAEKQGREVHYELEAGALVSTLRGVAGAIEQCWVEAGRSLVSEGAEAR
ncbi:MAG: helix-turn-helix transcriptional regulator, partial [Myxococcales bacterium]|nr:helix-turn-helix transcriptional regulator [Myxococcales bacterium]